jgi:hypothetical protein
MKIFHLPYRKESISGSDYKWVAIAIFTLAFWSFTSYSVAQNDSKKTKLFKEDQILDLELSYPFKELKSRKSDQPIKTGYLRFREEGQSWDSIPINAMARGNFRRDRCFFAPLKIKMKKKEVKGTIFKGNKKIKMVLPCQNAKDASDFLVKEFICYKLYEPLSPYHFKTRLANIKLTDEGSKQQKSYDVKAILIEDDKLIAKRFDAKLQKGKTMNPMGLQDTAVVIHDFFQFLIGNTDWSAAVQHNVTIMQLPSGENIPLCYDFDMTGMVNANYATVSEVLPISSVRERLYRGFCRDENLFHFARSYYLERETIIWEAFDNSIVHLNPKAVPGLKQYIAEFFDILKNERKFNEEILSKCRNIQALNN